MLRKEDVEGSGNHIKTENRSVDWKKLGKASYVLLMDSGFMLPNCGIWILYKDTWSV